MQDDEDEDKILEEDNGSGQEEEEEEEQQDPLEEDHVGVTNLLHLFNRSVTHPLPPDF